MTNFAITWMKHWGPWQIAYSARAICEDGKIRNVKITGQPDTFYTIPAKLTYRNKSVSGFITVCDTLDGKIVSVSEIPRNRAQDVVKEYGFIATGKHKNAFLE